MDYCASGTAPLSTVPFARVLPLTACKGVRQGPDCEAISTESYLDRRSCDRRTITAIQSAVTDTR